MAYPIYKDSFEAVYIDMSKWHTRQVPDDEKQLSFSNNAASGNQSITVTVTDGDGGVSCDGKCQRAEIRTRGPLRPVHEDEFWHAFSFKTSGDIPDTGSIRTVLGQWKAPGDDSPFLAQRFDNGVFHITVQDGPNRRTIASAEGDPDRLDQFQDLIAELSERAPEILHSTRALAKLKIFRKASSRLEAFHDRDTAYNLMEAVEALKDTNRSRAQELFDEFPFVHELDSYALKPKLTTKRSGPRMLPDPKQDWVRMAYRIKAGRMDNDPELGPKRGGEIDIYANGELIAKVSGNVGYKVTKVPIDRSIYFKFGIYRDKMPGTLNLHFDDFRQGRKLSDVM